MFWCIFALFALMICILFSCTVLFVSISQVIGCEDRLRNDRDYVGWMGREILLLPLQQLSCL